MNWKMKWYSILINGVLIVANSCHEKSVNNSRVEELPYYSDAYFTPHWLSSDSDSLIDFHQIPDFSLINQNGEPFTEKNVSNKIYVVNFFFTTCPGICPKVTANLIVVQDAFSPADSILLLSHTVTPGIDSLPRLKKYALEKEVWVPVIAQSELALYRSRDTDNISAKSVALMRHGFGGHPLHKK